MSLQSPDPVMDGPSPAGLDAAGPVGPEHVEVRAAEPPRAWRRLVRDPIVMIVVGFLVLVVGIAVLAPWVAPHDPYAQSVINALGSPSRDHLLGTDHLGRDILSRLMWGTRVSMRVSFIVVGIALVVALPIGLVIGYKGGRVDTIVMRLVDAGLSFPPIVLAVAVAGVRGPGVNNTILALTIVVTPGLIRFVRGQTLAVREETFIEASRSIGTPTRHVLATRVLRNILSPLMVQVAYLLGLVLIAEASLSYLGLGAQPPEASWGGMLRDAYDTALFTHGWMPVVPGVAIALTVLAFNELSDGMRDAMASSSRGQAHLGKGVARGKRGITSVPARQATPAAPAAPAAPAGAPAAEPGAAPAGDILRIEHLGVSVAGEHGAVEVLNDVSLSIGRGEVVGLAGESGSGKTVTAMSILRLLPSPPFRVTSGSVRFDGTHDLLALGLGELRRIRGREIGVVFQDPMTSLNPAMTIGHHLVQAQRFHRSVGRAEARRNAVEILDRVRIPSAARRIADYPHQLSGGMLQRVMIALALVNRPKLLIADEPTTALDVTVQAQVLDLLRELQAELDLSILFVTHDLGVIADLCDRVLVMYAGQVVEGAGVVDLFEHPRHPYSEGLLRASPSAEGARERLRTIPGMVPPLHALPEGCRFNPRCPYRTDACVAAPVPLRPLGTAEVRCVHADELRLDGVA